MHRHEHHVARLEPDVAAGVATEQIIVQIERRDRLAEAPHFDAAHVRALSHAARRVERREHRAERADLVRARLRDLAHDIDLVGAHVRHRDVEPRRRVRPSAHAGIHPPEARVQDVTQLVQREVTDEHLTDLGDQHEPLTRDLQRVRQLDVAGEDQHQHVSGTEPVIGGHGA